MALVRVVAPETLDGLAEADPAAQQSRRDLQRVHRAMGTQRIVRRGLHRYGLGDTAVSPLRLLELGAGDGTLMLGVARKLSKTWPRVELTLLDRQSLLGDDTVGEYAACGWTASAHVADVFDWAAEPADPAAYWDLIVANLFLHHFEAGDLARLLGAVAARSDRFFACEPRRSALALGASHLVGVLGANAVTREDAVLSVHAGFVGRELTAAWPAQGAGWKLREYGAGLFSHCFSAESASPVPAVSRQFAAGQGRRSAPWPT